MVIGYVKLISSLCARVGFELSKYAESAPRIAVIGASGAKGFHDGVPGQAEAAQVQRAFLDLVTRVFLARDEAQLRGPVQAVLDADAAFMQVYSSASDPAKVQVLAQWAAIITNDIAHTRDRSQEDANILALIERGRAFLGRILAPKKPRTSSSRSDVAVGAVKIPWTHKQKIVHEILMGRSGEEKDDMSKKVLEQVRVVADRAFYDLFTEELRQSPPNFSMVLGLLEETKERLNALTPNRVDLQRELKERIDVPLIAQQIEQDTFDRSSLVDYIRLLASRVSMLQDDITQAETQAWFDKAIEDILGDGDISVLLPSVFRTIHQHLRKLQDEIDEFHMSIIRMAVRDRGPDLERDTFRGFMEQDGIVLERSIACLKHVVNAWSADERGALARGDGPSLRRMTVDLLFSLLAKHTALQLADCPETFSLDVRQLVQFQNQIQIISLSLGLVMFVKTHTQSLGAKIGDSELAEYSRKLDILLKSPSIKLPALSAETVQAVRQSLERGGQSLSSDQAKFVEGIVDQTVSTTHRVYSLMHARLMTFVRTSINLDPNDQDGNDKLLADLGMTLLGAHAKEFVREVRKFYNSHMAIYFPFYNSLINEVVGQ
eukprot:TRINITY_DN40639_c0_g1_i1.p1 TRINITY_DN40639_c0_g1~~TRINITY_DN40639_c0_g1_i1.p1  ORF type:complete len:614 (+),score=128.81 TRINITY_DN40639_c0_g1_i1:33-1844(+)